MTETPQLDPAKTAMVLIEYQNDFTSEGGILHEAVSPVMEKTGMLVNAVTLVDAARKAGRTIMHAPSPSPRATTKSPATPSDIFKGVVDGNAFGKNSWGAAIVLGGFPTNSCVESTMHTGYENGYRVITVTDPPRRGLIPA
jgi:ureidoacrylate peracid hydrolase